MPTTDTRPSRPSLPRRPDDADPPTQAEVLDEHPELWAGLQEARRYWIVGLTRETVGRPVTHGKDGY